MDEVSSIQTTKGQRNARKIAGIVSFLRFDLKKPKNVQKFIEKFFWTYIYLTGSVLTILTCVDLYHQIKQNPASVSVSTIHRKTITPPDATIRLPFYHVQDLIDYLRGNMDELTLYNNTLNVFFENHTTWQEMENDEWPTPLIVLAQNYLATVFEVEVLRGYDLNWLNNKRNNNDSSTDKAIRQNFLPQLRKWNVTIGQLKLSFGRQFLDFFQVKVTLLGNNQTKELENLELIFVSAEEVCYKMTYDNIQLERNESVRIEINNEKSAGGYIWYCDYKIWYVDDWYCKKNGWQHKNPIFTGDEQITYEINGKTTAVDQLNSLIYFAYFGQYTQLTINPSIAYDSLPVLEGQQRCSVDSTRDECERKCRQQIIEEFCNCSNGTVTGSQCHIDRYEICLFNFTGTEDTNCSKQCLDSCLSWQYDIHTVRADVLWVSSFVTLCTIDSAPNIAVTEITVSSFDYILFTEEHAWTFEVIIGNIGGACGFWLGLDFLVIFHAIISAFIWFLIQKKFYGITLAEEPNPTLSQTVEETGTGTGMQNCIQRYIPKNWRVETWNIHNPDTVKWVISKLIWSCLFVIGAALTINMFVNLCQQYEQGGTQAVMTVMVNQPVSLPPSALCLPMSDNGYEFASNTTDGIIFNELNFDEYITDRETFLSRDHAWPDFIMYSTYIYLSAITTFEQGNYPLNDYYNYYMMNFTRQLVERYSITEDELLQKFTIDFANLLNISAHCFNSNENKTWQFNLTMTAIELSPIGIMNSYSICLHYPIETFNYQSAEDFCVISVTHPGNVNEILPDYFFWTIKSSTSYEFVPDVQLSSFRQINVFFDYTAVYQSRGIKNNCSMENIPPVDCLTKCRRDTAVNLCKNCTVLSNTTTAGWNRDKILQCDWEEYSYCLIFVPAYTNSCTDQCFPGCTYPTYKMESSFINYVENPPFPIGPQQLIIRISNFVYPFLSEQLAMTQSDFYSTSGGLLGFWLGLDMTFFISIIFAPLMFLIGPCRMKKQTTEEESSPNNHLFLSDNHFLNDISKKFFGIDISRQPLAFIFKSLFERIFWTVVYVYFGSFTLNMCVSCYQQMQTNPTSSSTVRMFNRTITIPMTTFCVPFYETNNETAVKEEDKNYMNELNIIKEKLLYTTFQWPPPLKRVAQQYFELIDGYKMLDQIDIGQLWSAFDQFQSQQRFDIESSAIDIFAKTIDHLNITYDELLQKFGQEMRKIYLLSLKKYDLRSKSLIVNSLAIDQISLVIDSKICYKIPTGAVTFSSEYEYISFRVEMLEFSSNTTEIGCSNTSIISIDLPGRVTGANSNNYLLTGSMTCRSTVALTITDVLQILPVLSDGVQRCSETTTPAMCNEYCAIRAIEKQCDCIPEGAKLSNTFDQLASRKNCTWAQLKTCMPKFSAMEAVACIKNCSISCKQVRYSISNTTVQPLISNDRCEAEYVISMNSLQYLVYAETFAFGFYNFVASLGGTLGIWLGIDLILLIEWFFKLREGIVTFIRFFKKPKKQEVKIERRRQDVVEPIMELQSV